DATMRQNGVGNPYEQHHKKPLADHLEVFRRELAARGNDPRYVSIVHARLSALFQGCGFVLIRDLSASQAMDWLARQRRDRDVPELPVGVEQFSRTEAAETIGMTATAFRDAVKRQGLPATGMGVARRYPRATVQ